MSLSEKNLWFDCVFFGCNFNNSGTAWTREGKMNNHESWGGRVSEAVSRDGVGTLQKHGEIRWHSLIRGRRCGFEKPRQQGRAGEAVSRDVVGTGTTSRVETTNPTHRQTLKCRVRIQTSTPGVTFDQERTDNIQSRVNQAQRRSN